MDTAKKCGYVISVDSDKHAAVAKKWLTATIWSTGVTLIVAIVFVVISFKYTPGSTAEAIQYVVSKIILLSTLSFGILVCQKL